MDLWRLLLGAAPQSVRLAPGSLQQGAESIADIREAARCLREKLLGASCQPSWRLIADRASMAAPYHIIAGEPPVSDSGAGNRRKSPIHREGENYLDREERCLKVVRKLRVGVEYKPWELPREVWHCLQENLGKGSLRSFLERNPAAFEIIPYGERFTFKMKPTVHGQLWKTSSGSRLWRNQRRPFARTE